MMAEQWRSDSGTGSPGEQPSDADLLTQVVVERQYGQGEDALGALYDRYGSRVYSLALHILGDSELAKVVVEEVFVRLWHSAETLQGLDVGSALLRWLLHLTHGLAITTLRSHQQSLSWASQRVQRSATPDVASPAQQAIDLALFGGFTCVEIAALTNSTPDRVAYALHLGLHCSLEQLE